MTFERGIHFKSIEPYALCPWLPKTKPPLRTLATPDTLKFLCEFVCNNAPLPDAFRWNTEEVLHWIGKMGFKKCKKSIEDISKAINWSDEEVLKFIEDIGFPHFKLTFATNHINGYRLCRLDASALVRMNIKCFNDITVVTKNIRRLFELEQPLFSCSISRPYCNPDTCFKYSKTSSGPSYAAANNYDFWSASQIIAQTKPYLNHWQLLTEVLKLLPNPPPDRVGQIRRKNLYLVKARHIPLPEYPECDCMPPCTAHWDEHHTRKPWVLKSLRKWEAAQHDNESN